jgi:hypothetical protein
MNTNQMATHASRYTDKTGKDFEYFCEHLVFPEDLVFPVDPEFLVFPEDLEYPVDPEDLVFPEDLEYLPTRR